MNFKILIFIFIFILSNMHIFSQIGSSLSKYGTPLSNVKNEIINLSLRHRNDFDNSYSFSVDNVHKYDRQKRFLYWLNLKNSKLGKVKIKSSDMILVKGNKPIEVREHTHIKPLKRSISQINTERFQKSFLEVRSLISVKTSGSALSTFRFQNIEHINFSEPDNSTFYAIFGVNRKFKKNHGLYFNLFVNKNREEQLRLTEFSGLYKYNFLIDRNILFEPQISFFLPVNNTYYNYFSETDRKGFVIAPAFIFRTHALNYMDINYHLSFYYNSQDSSKNIVLNSIKLDNRFKSFGLTGGVNALSRPNYLNMIKFFTLYYSYITGLTKEFRVAFSLDNEFISLSDFKYTFGISYNF